jgi:hypothetical protein
MSRILQRAVVSIFVFFWALRVASAYRFRSGILVHAVARRETSRRGRVSMRDGSTATNYFSVGDTVRVISDVYCGGVNTVSMVGSVIEVWEKCEVSKEQPAANAVCIPFGPPFAHSLLSGPIHDTTRAIQF